MEQLESRDLRGRSATTSTKLAESPTVSSSCRQDCVQDINLFILCAKSEAMTQLGRMTELFDSGLSMTA